MKSAAGAFAIAAPVVLGWGLTGDGFDVDLFGEDTQGHTVDQWSFDIEGEGSFVIDREEIDGQLTVTITDQDGNLVDPADLPAEVAGDYDEFASEDWEPADNGPIYERDGGFCYDMTGVAAEWAVDDENSNVMTTDNTLTIVLADGAEITQAVHFADSPWDDHDEFVTQLEAGADFSSMEGAEPLQPCD